MHKMPYKHIAAHLQKTELACRLHYHQMSYGSNRRRRNSSVSSTASSVFSHIGRREGSPEYGSFTQLSPVQSPPSSPEPVHSKPVMGHDGQGQQRSHVPILPRPTLSPHREETIMERPEQGLKIDTSFVKHHHQHHHHYAPRVHQEAGQPIDPARLQSIYEAHRASFWSVVASEYSPSGAAPPAQLEEAFFAFCVRRGSLPATPDSSPRAGSPSRHSTDSCLTSSRPRGFSAINEPAPIQLPPLHTTRPSSQSPGERCAVSALLNEEPRTESVSQN